MKEKLDRNQRIYNFHLSHPDMTLQAIANVFHLKSKQRIFAIIQKYKGNGNVQRAV